MKEDDVDRQRDEIIKRMAKTPPKPHHKGRRLVRAPEVKDLPKRRTNKKRDKA